VLVQHGREPFARRLSLAPGENVTVDAELPFTAQTLGGMALVATGTVVGLMAVLPLGLALAAEQRAVAVEASLAQRPLTPTQVGEYRALEQERNLDVQLAGAALAVGVVMAGAGGALWLLDEPAEPQR
jgi:hypothetical protein